MKKWMVIILCLFLIACNDKNTLTADSPEKALQLLDSNGDYPKITKILNSTKINDKQIFYVFEGKVNNQAEWFVANIELNDDLKWFVNESINIGLPNKDNGKYSAGTNSFTAGLSNNVAEQRDNRIIVNIPDNDYYVWIELHKNDN